MLSSASRTCRSPVSRTVRPKRGHAATRYSTFAPANPAIARQAAGRRANILFVHLSTLTFLPFLLPPPGTQPISTSAGSNDVETREATASATCATSLPSTVRVSIKNLERSPRDSLRALKHLSQFKTSRVKGLSEALKADLLSLESNELQARVSELSSQLLQGQDPLYKTVSERKRAEANLLKILNILLRHLLDLSSRRESSKDGNTADATILQLLRSSEQSSDRAFPWEKLPERTLTLIIDWLLPRYFVPRISASIKTLPSPLVDRAARTIVNRVLKSEQPNIRDLLAYLEVAVDESLLSLRQQRALFTMINSFISQLAKSIESGLLNDNFKGWQEIVKEILTLLQRGDLPSSLILPSVQLLNSSLKAIKLLEPDPDFDQLALTIRNTLDSVVQRISSTSQNSLPLYNTLLQAAFQGLASFQQANSILISLKSQGLRPDGRTLTIWIQGTTQMRLEQSGRSAVASFEWPENVREQLPKSDGSESFCQQELQEPLSIDDQSLAAILHHFVVFNHLPLAAKMITALLPRLSVWALTWRRHFSRAQKDQLRPAGTLEIGPELYLALLHVAVKKGQMGLAQRIWHSMQVASARSQNTALRLGRLGNRKPWLVPVAAYTMMLQLCAQEARHTLLSRKPYVKGWDLGPVTNRTRRQRLKIRPNSVRRNTAKAFAWRLYTQCTTQRRESKMRELNLQRTGSLVPDRPFYEACLQVFQRQLPGEKRDARLGIIEGAMRVRGHRTPLTFSRKRRRKTRETTLSQASASPV